MNSTVRVTVFALLSVLCVVFCGNGFLCAQPSGGPGGGPCSHKERLPSPRFDKAPFDITCKNLAPVYIGHDIRQIYDAIKREIRVETDEETILGQTEEKPSRETILPLIESINLSRTYAFQIRPAENFFDARENTLKVYCELSALLSKNAEDKTKRGFRVRYAPWVDNHLTYTNADGKEMEIKELKFRDYTVAFGNFRQFPIENSMLPSEEREIEKRRREGIHEPDPHKTVKREMIVTKLKIEPSEAYQLKESTMMLIVCNPADPYITSSIVQRKGTPEKPGEYLAIHEYLHVHLLELWFYDVVTGRVLMKIKPENIPRLP